MPFNPEEYWSTREHRKWVVYLTKRLGYSKMTASDKKIVRAPTHTGACKTSRYHSNLTGNVSASARLVYPHDLGIQT